MEPTAAEISTLGLETLGPLAKWAGMRDADIDALASFLGFDTPEFAAAHPRLLCAMPFEVFCQSLTQWQIGGQAASMRVQMAARTLHTGAVAVCRPVVAAVAPPDPQAAIASQAIMGQAIMALASAVSAKDTRKVKVAQILDPADSSDLSPASPTDVTQWFANYVHLKGGDPLPDREPTADQLAAMHSRVVIHKMEPYGDFSLLTPNGKRFATEMKYNSWVPMEDGTWQSVRLPGPADFTTWASCWRVYEVILLMLRDVDSNGNTVMVATPNSLEHYYVAFELLCKENPEAWHRCVQAEDRCRSEHFPRVWRTEAAKLGRAPTWSEVFVAAANDGPYWDKAVRRPAISDLIRTSGKNAGVRALSAEQDAAMRVTEAVDEMRSGTGKKSVQRGKGRGRTKGGAGTPKPPTTHPAQRPGKGDDKKAKKDHRGRYITIDGGRDICFRYNNGSCKEPCPQKRAHFCQVCLKKSCKAKEHDNV